MKICPKCPEKGPQPLENFAIKHGNRRSYQCKECKRLYNIGHYQRNKSTYHERAKLSASVIREWLNELKSGLKCTRCPESHPAAIQFHHTDPTNKEIELGSVVKAGWGKERILREIAKCVVLCANCHLKLHWEEARG